MRPETNLAQISCSWHRGPFPLSLAPQQAQAACVLTTGPGVDNYVCDSGSSPTGLTDTVGNVTLTLPAGGTGIINGNIVTGPGSDAVDMNSGASSVP